MSSVSRTKLPWACDNDAFTGFNASKFRRFLHTITGHVDCLFVACPDVVGDARATLERFGEWAIEILSTGQPVAFVGQDGAENLVIPWSDFDAWFIGGSTRWKLSQASADLACEAKAKGKHVHMGRCNSLRRLQAALDMGCDSVDGSSMSMFGDAYILRFANWIDQLRQQPLLWEEAP